MSFILDALKKSESDRQRQSGPALFEVKVASPKARYPAWAIAIVVLLVVNLCIVGWLLLRRGAHDDTANNTPAVAANTAPLTAVQPTVQPPADTYAPTAARSQPTLPPQTSQGVNPSSSAPTGNPGSRGDGAEDQRQSGSGSNNGSGSPSGPAEPQRGRSLGGFGAGAQSADPTPADDARGNGIGGPAREPTLAGSGASIRDPASGAGGNTGAASGGNPDDYAPATEGGEALFKGHVRRGTESGVILYQDAAVVPGANLPQLRLDLHVYAVKPQDRFALINMHKMHEGDALPDGVKVEAITPDGVIMSHNGSRFLLPRD